MDYLGFKTPFPQHCVHSYILHSEKPQEEKLMEASTPKVGFP